MNPAPSRPCHFHDNEVRPELLTRSTALSPAFEGGDGKRRSLRQAQDTEFTEVQGQPDPSTRAQAEGQAPAFMPGSRRIDYKM